MDAIEEVSDETRERNTMVAMMSLIRLARKLAIEHGITEEWGVAPGEAATRLLRGAAASIQKQEPPER